MVKRVLTVRGVPEATLRNLRNAAKRSRRSLNSELLVVLESAARPSNTPIAATVAVREPEPMPYHSGGSVESASPPSIDREALAAICRRFHVKSLALFGSRALGVARRDSDVDVLAEFEPGMTPGFGIVAIADALGPVLGGKVDLVTRRGLSPRFLSRILPTAVSLYDAG
jgi:predicted nucleotidyltransferase